AATWLKNNVNPNDLILNDRSYASFYIQGFSLLNLTHNYFNGYTKPMQTYLTAKDLMPRELNAIWIHPEKGYLVYSLLKKYNIRYIVLMEGGYADFANWGGSGKKLVEKNNSEYQRLFNSYPFLQLKYQKGRSAVYFVKYAQ